VSASAVVTRPARTELPPWLGTKAVAWMASLLALVALVLAAGFAWYEQRELHERELHTGELLARVLEDHANRSFNTVDIALGTLADTLRSKSRLHDPISFGPTLAQAQQGMPLLRSLSLVDAQGRVLASSAPDNVDLLLDLQRVLPPQPGITDRLGPLVTGRDIAHALAGEAPRAGGHSFVPLVRWASAPNEAPLYLVAALNIDYFANEHQLMLSDPGRAAALVGTDGTLLTSTDGIGAAPGSNLRAHRFFRDFLPRRESGSYIGAGIDGGEVVTALRTLRKRPLAVVVERDYGWVQAELARTLYWVSGALAAALLLIGIMAGLAWRSLRSHEAVHDALESTREQVAASERDLRTLVQSVHELIFRTDAQGRIGFVNGRWAEISGLGDEAVLGQRLAQLCLPEERDAVEALFAPPQAHAAPAARELMVHIRHAQGGLRMLEVSVAAMHADDQTLIGFAGFAADVSERQLARSNLQAQLELTARLLEVSPTPLFVKDSAGRFIMVNHAWLDLMALQRHQVIGRTSADLYGEQAGLHADFDQRLMQSQERISYPNRLQRPDGEQRDTVVTKVRFTEADGQAVGIIGSIIDVTEFREAERVTREARDAAEKANQAKSDFIANISHELRTPLQSIIGFSELGRSLAEAQPDFEEMFDDIHAGGQRMLKLVNGLLDVSKMDSSVGSLALRRCDLLPLAAAVVKELGPLAAQRGLHIAVQGFASDLQADADAFRLQQVLRNVLANAMRFAPMGSAIEISGHELGTAGVELQVRDHGPGIPPDELETIFDAFVQSSRTQDGSGGTGLGLTICRKIMSAHGGRIVARNAGDGGAIFCLQLPAPAPLQVPDIELPALEGVEETT
jgi:PAS domain S-box-containing protein